MNITSPQRPQRPKTDRIDDPFHVGHAEHQGTQRGGFWYNVMRTDRDNWRAQALGAPDDFRRQSGLRDQDGIKDYLAELLKAHNEALRRVEKLEQKPHNPETQPNADLQKRVERLEVAPHIRSQQIQELQNRVQELQHRVAELEGERAVELEDEERGETSRREAAMQQRLEASIAERAAEVEERMEERLAPRLPVIEDRLAALDVDAHEQRVTVRNLGQSMLRMINVSERDQERENVRYGNVEGRLHDLNRRNNQMQQDLDQLRVQIGAPAQQGTPSLSGTTEVDSEDSDDASDNTATHDSASAADSRGRNTPGSSGSDDDAQDGNAIRGFSSNRDARYGYTASNNSGRDISTTNRDRAGDSGPGGYPSSGNTSTYHFTNGSDFDGPQTDLVFSGVSNGMKAVEPDFGQRRQFSSPPDYAGGGLLYNGLGLFRNQRNSSASVDPVPYSPAYSMISPKQVVAG